MAKKRVLALSAPAALVQQADPTGERRNLLALCEEPIERLKQPGWRDGRLFVNPCKLLCCNRHSIGEKIEMNVPFPGLFTVLYVIVLRLMDAGFETAVLLGIGVMCYQIYLSRLKKWRWHSRAFEAEQGEVLKAAPDEALSFLSSRLGELRQNFLEDNRAQVGKHSTLAKVCAWFEGKKSWLAAQAQGFRKEALSTDETYEFYYRLMAATRQVEALLNRIDQSMVRFNAFKSAFERLHQDIQNAVRRFSEKFYHEQRLAKRFTDLEKIQRADWDQVAAEIHGEVEPLLADLPPLFDELAKLKRCGERLRAGVEKLEDDEWRELLTQLDAFDEAVQEAQDIL